MFTDQLVPVLWLWAALVLDAFLFGILLWPAFKEMNATAARWSRWLRRWWTARNTRKWQTVRAERMREALR